MIKYDADFCRSRCPFRKDGEKFRMKFQSVHSASITPAGYRTTFFFHPASIYGPDCIKVHVRSEENEARMREARKNPFAFLEKYIDVEKDAMDCPLYAEMMMHRIYDE